MKFTIIGVYPMYKLRIEAFKPHVHNCKPLKFLQQFYFCGKARNANIKLSLVFSLKNNIIQFKKRSRI